MTDASERNARFLLSRLNLKLNERDTRLLLARLELNPRIVENPYWFLPVADDGHDEYVQAGRGPVSSDWCMKFKGRIACHVKEHHEGVVFKDVDFTGMNVVMSTYYHCFKVLCVKCFISGFSVREAQVIEGRIVKAVERGFGVPEHFVLSPPVYLRGLPFSTLFKLGELVLRDRWVTGAVLIPHGRRIGRKVRKLVWSPHIHGLGFIFDGFGRCRSCVHERGDCALCDGFKGRQVRGYVKDGWIVKVEPPRKSVFGTAHYLLNHCTVKVGLKRFHAVRWFGLLGNRNFKGNSVRAKAVCPVCKVGGHFSEMVSEAYWGSKPLSDSGVNAVPDLGDDGKPNFPSFEER